VNQSTSQPLPTAHRLADWHASGLGAVLASHERHVVRPALEDCFGLHMLQIGAWGDSGSLIDSARTQRRAVVGSSPACDSDVCSKPSELAVASDSVDAVLLPHTLELEPDPYAVLREVQRVLVGDGRLIVLGFTPTGPWALRHRFTADGFPPGLIRLISERRLREWLTLLGFEVGASQRYLPRLPVAPGPGAGVGKISEGRIRLALFGSGYLLKARKRVYMVMPARPKWRERRAIVGGLVEPTTRARATSVPRIIRFPRRDAR
jgi:SAM-dependent methyltransferase